MIIEGAEIIICDNIRFIITDSRIIVSTNLQAFVLTPREYCWNKRLSTVKFMIQIGRIYDLNSLAEFCENRIEWTPTKIPMM